jgi:hypothetical protein
LRRLAGRHHRRPVGRLRVRPKDEFAGRSAEKLYAEAKADADAGSYDRAIKALERVEGLGAGTLLAQQSQLDLAYLYWKTNEKAQALSPSSASSSTTRRARPRLRAVPARRDQLQRQPGPAGQPGRAGPGRT